MNNEEILNTCPYCNKNTKKFICQYCKTLYFINRRLFELAKHYPILLKYIHAIYSDYFERYNKRR